MTQIHLVFRRINPELKIDFAQVGYIKDGHFVNLPISYFENTIFSVSLKKDSISDGSYIFHSDISALVSDLSHLPGFGIEYFDNTLVLMFDFKIDFNEDSLNESPSKEENSGH